MSASSGGANDLSFIAKFDDCDRTDVRCGPYSCRPVRRRRWRLLLWGIQWRCKRFWHEWQRSHEQWCAKRRDRRTNQHPVQHGNRWYELEQCRGRSGDTPSSHQARPALVATRSAPVLVAPGKVLGLWALLEIRPVSATSDRKPRRSSALRSRVTRRPRAFATGADPRCSLTGKLGR